jgi:predicted esterase/transglutaminase-like putative cysteine protease
VINLRAPGLAVGLLLGVVSLAALPAAPPEEKTTGWPAEVERALGRAGTNRDELVKALADVPPEQHKGMAFLIANMSDRDLKSLSAAFLLDNVALAYKARRELPWGRQIPEDIFLNDVLPYANVDEARDPWRKDLYELCLPLLKDCQTPAEAAHRLNGAIFPKLHVRYSTERKQPHQSPKETIASGKATCTGLSILLSDACRSVAVPARLAGTPLWANHRGNHTWVEIWDGAWHFAGAAEPDPKGLDHAWFEHDAAEAKKDSRLEAIYAASFRRTDVTFPLVWARDSNEVYAENVTDRYTRPRAVPAEKPLPEERRRRIEKSAAAFFAAGEAERARWQFDPVLDRWLAEQDGPVRRAAWEAYRAAPIHDEQRKDFEAHQVRHGKYVSPYTVRQVGSRPKDGWPLFIALHGGGRAPTELNDEQWKVMQHYYRDQPTVTGYLYLALRAPNDTWNGFYDEYVPPLITILIREFLLFGDVDPNKVFLMGYSHGGYGAFYVGPKIPDRFAAVHASAAAPTDGAISPKTLRHTRFTYMVGENDNAYGRRERCAKFNDAVRRLQEENKGDYPVEMELKKGFGHGGLPDRDKILEMYPYVRDPVPRHLTWELTDAVVSHFFWLSVPEPGKNKEMDVVLRDNEVSVTAQNVGAFDLDLDSRLVAFDRPLRVSVDGKVRVLDIAPHFLTLCRSLLERGDPELAWTCQIRLP